MERRVLAPSRQDLVIAPASLGNGAGRLGAARLALSVCQAARDDAWQSPCPGVESGRSRSLPELLARASRLRRHAIDLAQCSDQQRQDALRAMADALSSSGR